MNNKRKFLKHLEVIVSAMLVVSAPLSASAMVGTQDNVVTTAVQSVVQQNDSSTRAPLLVERSNAQFSKVGHYSHSSHSSHSSHASHYSSSM